MPPWRLILDEIFPLSPQPLNFNDQRATSINGTGVIASKWVSALEKLTLQKKLRFLTFLSWANVLSAYKLLRGSFAWCPLCFKEWRETGQEIYQPLLWAIQAVEVCPIHLVTLRFKCPNPDCQKDQFILAHKLRPGYCSHCGQWLGILTGEEISVSKIFKDNHVEWQNWVINVVGELLAVAPSLTILPERKVTAETISSFVNLMNGDKETIISEIGTSIVSMRNWINGKMLPQFEMLLRICYYFKTSPLQFFTRVSLDRYSGEVNAPIWDKNLKKRHNVDYDQIRQKMEKILKDENPPAPICDLPKRFGCSKSILYYYFPELYRAISTKYKDYRKKCSIQKLQRMCEEIRSLAKQIHAEGNYPSVYQIQKRSSVSAIFRHPEVLAAWHVVLKELGWES